jgi:hypothetical protein
MGNEITAALHRDFTLVIAEMIGLSEDVEHVAFGGDDVRRQDGAVCAPRESRFRAGTRFARQEAIQRVGDCGRLAAVERAAVQPAGNRLTNFGKEVIDLDGTVPRCVPVALRVAGVLTCGVK